MELVQISISALLLNWPQHVLAPLVLFQIGLARYLRLRSYRTVLIFACLQLVGLATWCFSHGQAWPSIVALGCLSVYFFGLAIRNQAESLVVCGYVSLGAMFGTLKLFGIIGDLGISEFVLLVVSVLLERLCTRLKGDARIFLRPTQWVYEALPLILLVMQFVERDSPLLVLCSALVLEYFNQSEEMSHHRLAALVAINYALFLYAAPSGYVLELVSMSSGFSVLWYAHSMRQHLAIKSRQNLNIVGCGLFYMGSLYHFVIAATVESLVILWGLCFLSGLVALWFRSRLQLFSAMIIFCLSLVFFVVRQVLSQMSTGIPLVAGLGALLILCGVLLEQNRERLSSLFQSIEDYFELKD